MLTWIARLLALEIVKVYVRRLAFYIKVKVKTAKNKVLKEKLTEAKTDEEKQAAIKAVIEHFNRDDLN
jgi:hypothetical protein